MTKLRDSMPVIANSARDVSNQIGSAGRTASAQLGELVAGFERLNEFGLASERQVASLRARVDEAIATFAAQADQLQTVADARFAALRTESETFRVSHVVHSAISALPMGYSETFGRRPKKRQRAGSAGTAGRRAPRREGFSSMRSEPLEP